MEEKRAKTSKRLLDKKLSEDANTIKVTEDIKTWAETVSKTTGKPEKVVFEELIRDSQYAFVEFDETSGKASLVFTSWDNNILQPEKMPSEKLIQEYRNLRDNFALVSAGIEWHKDFSAEGFTVQIDDPKDEHKQAMREIIKNFCRDVYQDFYTKGLDSILDIMIDEAFTVGMDAAEIVYEKEVVFEDYLETEMEKVIIDGKPVPVPVPIKPNWRDLGGITRLKIIEDAVTRMKPYRHPISGEILYWTLDEKSGQQYATKQAKTIKYHPWEIFLLSVNRRGTNLKSRSLIEPVYTIAKFVQQIHIAVGKGFARWSNKRYFFVTGDPKRQWSKPSLANFMTAMEQMIKNNWVGIPVPYGFDVKNIGGEETVFEGKNLLDHLTGIILAGMQIPRDFIEVGRTQGGDKPWLAWQVRYNRNQLLIRRAIEQQLFQIHLNCKFGETYRVSKKGVPINEQEKRAIYVPKVAWKSEGRWHVETKIKMLGSMLNVANPIDPVLKLAVEKDMADTLGMGELDWDAYIDLFNMQIKSRITQEKIDQLASEAKLKYYQELEKAGKLMDMLMPKQQAQPTQPQQPIRVPTEEEILQQREQRRLEGGVSRTGRGQPTGKGKSKPMGGTRTPTPIGETMEETVPIPPQKVQIEVTAKSEPTKIEIETKNEPQKIQIETKTEPQKIEIEATMKTTEADQK